MQGICSAHTPLGLAVSRGGLESFDNKIVQNIKLISN